MMSAQFEHAAQEFHVKKNYETAAELTKWLMLGVADDQLASVILHNTCQEIGFWLARTAGIVSVRVHAGPNGFRQTPSLSNAALYMDWLAMNSVSPPSKEEIVTGLFEVHHWLVQAGRQTHLYFQK
jgi:hypothetical protein